MADLIFVQHGTQDYLIKSSFCNPFAFLVYLSIICEQIVLQFCYTFTWEVEPLLSQSKTVGDFQYKQTKKKKKIASQRQLKSAILY